MTVRTVLCYGDSNTHGTMPMPEPFAMGRFGSAQRWPGVMRVALGAGWSVIEEGLPGRTTVHDDPLEGAHMNGLAHLKPTLSSHLPIDVLVLMLGTNDLKMRFSLPAFDVASGMLALCETALAWGAGPGGGAPKLVVVSPVPIVESAWLGEMFTGGEAKGRRLARLYRGVAERVGAAFFDAGTVAEISPVDGVHFDAEQHRKIGEGLAGVVSKL